MRRVQNRAGAAVGRIAAMAAGGAAGIAFLLALGGDLTVSAQSAFWPIDQAPDRPETPAATPDVRSTVAANPDPPRFDLGAEVGGRSLLEVPITTVYPGGVKPSPETSNPPDDPEAVQRGMRYFNQFNCIGCHAPNGAGGMGPALSNHVFIYGSEPANIYLSILQGRPAGMPVFGGLLPDQVIWDVVAYIRSISRAPKGQWGTTVSADGFSTEQVPAEFLTTTEPWEHLNPFSYGQAPFEKPKGSPPLETPSDGGTR